METEGCRGKERKVVRTVEPEAQESLCSREDEWGEGELWFGTA